jgi:hypothetical protein
MAREYAPDEPVAKQREYAAEPKQDLYEKVSGQLREALPAEEGRQRFVGPMLAAGAGELARGVGAATQIVAPETGKKISDVGRAVVDVTKERYPVTGTLGQLGSYVYPYKAAETAVTKVLPRKLTPEGKLALGREAQIAGAAGGVTGAVTAEGDLVDRAFGGALGTTLGIGGTYVGALASKGYEWTKSTLQRAFGGDAKRMAEALRSYASSRSGAEADAAKKMAYEAEQKAGIAETAEQKALRQQELAYRELPGTKTEMEAGRFKPIPTSEQAVGDRIRGYVDRIFKDLKATRAKNAERLKGAPFYMAAESEMLGGRVANTNTYKQMEKLVQNQIRNEQGLVSAPGATGTKLKELQNILDGTVVDDATGVVIKNDLSFEGMERLRRQLSDRSYGFPETGFDALSQQEAGKYAKMVADAMEEFSPGLKRFLSQYQKDSEPLRVFQTKTGKIFEEQLPGVKGYAKVSSENIPSKVFKDRESYQGLIEALGGNKAFAENEARKYFAGQMEKLAGDPKKLEAFIRDNRTMLNLTNARDMAESYIARASAFAKRGEAAKTRAGAEREIATKQAELAKDFAKLESDLVTAQTPQEIAGLHGTLAKKLLNEGTINQQQYRTMLQEATRVLQTVKDKEVAKQQLIALTRRGVVGAGLASAAYVGIKKFGE